MKCLICGFESTTNAGLGHHIKCSHKLTTQKYYDLYVNKTNNKCSICGKPNKFQNFVQGYSLGCCTEHTNLIKYGVSNVSHNEKIKDKIKQSKLDKYGNANYNNHTQALATLNKKYNTNVNNVANIKEIKEKIYQTNKNKLGVEMPFMSDDIQEKCRDTKEIKYGNKNYTNRPKFYNTMKKRNFISKYELALEKVFEKYNINYIPQYKEIRYPFHCDFYLTDFDIFIEINIYPAHGKHPYDKDNIDDIKLVKTWMDLYNQGKLIYKDWIRRWTIVDVNKRNIAKKNKLQYFELFNLDEMNEFIKNILHIKNEDIKTIYQNL